MKTFDLDALTGITDRETSRARLVRIYYGNESFGLVRFDSVEGTDWQMDPDSASRVADRVEAAYGEALQDIPMTDIMDAVNEAAYDAK